MEKKETDKFVYNYTHLNNLFRKARTSSDYVFIMYHINGGYLDPFAVFKNTGRIRDKQQLHQTVNSMFRRILKVNAKKQIVCNFLNINQHSAKQLRNTSPKLNNKNNSEFNSIGDLRAYLLKQKYLDSQIYFTSNGRIRKDMGKMLYIANNKLINV